MPKLGMEPIRRKALIDAAISTIHDEGFCGVTISRIARRAGVSSGLAHHYFGSKELLLDATMRHLLNELGEGIRGRLHQAKTPRERLRAIVEGNFASEQFQPSVISAWLAFYLQAASSPKTKRLLRIYSRRLQSNLVHALFQILPRKRAEIVAEGTAALIDGLWIRRALEDGPPNPATAVALVEDYTDTQIRMHRLD